MLEALEALRQSFPEYAKDIKLNLSSVLSDSSLSVDQRWGVAVASAIACNSPQLKEATLADARNHVEPRVLEDAAASAVLMAMNNIYYRFRHMVDKPSYGQKPPRLRMNRIMQPTSTKVDFELYSLAVSAIHGCEMCVQSHEKALMGHNVTEDQVNDAIRIAAVFHAAAQVLTAGL
ncbi:carboxymuconolactone decarboxylase family protein [Humisphaera borealis]|uniref:Alkyl hydroperoxide reductase AhpD n=1 Tax=Humisphaera borealis TaxID=2807512 RepID=A0A7M2WVI4_9BACT|nr:carboxymuconolactone decarboxylase family protein [Humisphaera borealis]QOV89399.1 carboxymuconolactone decarboxylase family protein [Humisphaera borealis]